MVLAETSGVAPGVSCPGSPYIDWATFIAAAFAAAGAIAAAAVDP
jgi:hypothetical protein